MILVVVSFGIPLNFTSRALPHLPHLDPMQPVAPESEWGQSDWLRAVQHPFQQCDTILFPLWRHFGGRVTSLKGHVLALCSLCSVPAWYKWLVPRLLTAFQLWDPDAQVCWRPLGVSEPGVFSLGVDVWGLQQEGGLFSAWQPRDKGPVPWGSPGRWCQPGRECVALLAGLVWLRAVAAPARGRGMAARFSPVLLAEWLG